MNKLTPARVNNETGDTMCVVRWMAETPDGWLGAWDKEAFDAFIKDAVAAERERCVDRLTKLRDILIAGFGGAGYAAEAQMIDRCIDEIKGRDE